jgi:hypothetical protein
MRGIGSLREFDVIRFVLALVVALFVFVDVAPVFAQNETVLVAQQQRRRTLFDLLFGEPEPQPAPVEQPQQPRRQPQPQASLPPPKPQIEKAADATRVAVFGTRWPSTSARRWSGSMPRTPIWW